MKQATIQQYFDRVYYKTVRCMGKIKPEIVFVCLVCVFKNW